MVAGPNPIAVYLAEALGDVDPLDMAWLNRLVNCFPLPTIKQAPELLAGLERVAKAVPWAGELLADDFIEPLARLAPAVNALGERRGFGRGGDESYQGEYLQAGTLLVDDPELDQPRALEALRAVLIACRWRWVAEGEDARNVTASDRLASSIRGVVRGSSKLESQLLYTLGQAQTLEEFIVAARGILVSEHKTLAEVWPTVEGALLGVSRPRRRSGPRHPAGPGLDPHIPGVDGPPVVAPPAPEIQRPPKPDAEEVIEQILAGIKTGGAPRPQGAPAPIGGELPADISPVLTTVPRPKSPSNSDEQAVQRYEAAQGIWSTNQLLLPNHRSVLSAGRYSQVVQDICSLLMEPRLDHQVAYGACGLLVQALTGRTPKTLSSLEVLKDGREEHDPRWLDLLLAEGAFRMSAFWRVPRDGRGRSHARPTATQDQYVEEVGDEIYLPLAPAFLQAFRLHAERLRALSRTSLEETEARLRQAAALVGDRLGLRFTMGQLRSSASTHLYESCRDLSAVQLLCGDTVGHTLAGLSYYAPKKQALAEFHWSLQKVLLGVDIKMPKLRQLEGRAGAPLLARTTHAKALAKSPAKALHYGVPRLVNEKRFGEIHLAMVNHFSGMLVAAATHRPGEALLKLKRTDFWVDGGVGAALFQDKVHDAAHDPRLVALPETICRQMDAYFEHLSGLAKQLPTISGHVSKVLKGDAPLFFLISEEGKPISLDYEGWKSGLPPLWHALPLNWGRHWVRTHAAEKGVRPEVASIQMGHLELVGYPFSRASPTEPWCFVQEAAPGWEVVVRAQGWQVMRGVPADAAAKLSDPAPLRLWDRSVKDHEVHQREVARQWRLAMRAKLREYKEDAREWVLLHPKLIDAGVVARFNLKEQRQEAHGLTRSDFERIRDEAYDSAEDDLALAIARANELCRVVKIVNRRTGQVKETPGELMHFRRPLDNAFIPGMMEAVQQVYALREHVSRNLTSATSGRWDDMASSCACAVLAMTVFGGCDQKLQIMGAIERRDQLQRSARLEDTILVPWGDEAHQAIALRGVPAIVLARLAWKRGKDQVPEWGKIEASLAGLLPDWAIGNGKGASGILDRLCETVAVANRYELSPAARRALGISGGSTPAHIREQIAFVDGDPVGTVSRSWAEVGDVSPPAQSRPRRTVRKGNARTQYLELCGAFPSTERVVELEATGEEIRSGEAASPDARTKLTEEIQARMEEHSPERVLHPVVRLLAGWTLDMLINGTPKRDDPALSTVKTYLTRIGGILVHVFAQSSMRYVDDVELESAYLAAIQSKLRSRQKAAAAVLSFHAFGQREYGLPEIDLSEVKVYLGDDPDALSDARLILPAERDVIVEFGADKSEAGKGEESPHLRRIKHLVGFAMPLYGRAGLRRSEAMGLQFRDVSESDGWIRVQVRPNMSRRLKTSRATRVVEVPAGDTVEDSLTLAEWIKVERQRLPGERLETAYVFSSVDAPFEADSRSEIIAECMAACRRVTGHEGARLHHLRHLVAMERVTPVFLSTEDQEGLAASLSLAQVQTLRGELALPRDLLGQVIELGHVDALTTLISYHHLSWLFRSRVDAWHAKRYLNRSVLAPLLGVTTHALDWAVKQRPGRSRAAAWLDVSVAPRVIPLASGPAASPISHAQPNNQKASLEAWSAMALSDLLDDVARMGSLEKTLIVLGRDPSQADLIRSEVSVLEGRLGRRLLSERSHAGVSGAPKRVLRRVDHARSVDVLLEWYDGDVDERRQSIAGIAKRVCEFMQSAHRDQIHVPEVQATELEELLLSLGIDEAEIESVSIGAGIRSVRIRQPKKRAVSSAEKTASEVKEPESNEPPPHGDKYLGFPLKRTFALIYLSSLTGPV